MKAPRAIILSSCLCAVMGLGVASAAWAGYGAPDASSAGDEPAAPVANTVQAAAAGSVPSPILGAVPLRNAARAQAAAVDSAQAAADPSVASPSQTAEAEPPIANAPRETASRAVGASPESEPAREPEGDEPPDAPGDAPSAETPEADAPAPAPEPAPAAPASSPRTLYIGGAAIPYRDVRGGTTPDGGAGLWLGSDSTADGSWGYFVGHNPGPFAPVKSLGCGSTVTLCDAAGATRTYTVRDVFTVEATATWKTITGRVTGYGESLILQTCTGDGATNTIVVAA